MKIIFFQLRGERTVDGNVTLNDLIYYANYPYLVKLSKFLQSGLFRMNMGFNIPIFFLYLLIFYFFLKIKFISKNF